MKAPRIHLRTLVVDGAVEAEEEAAAEVEEVEVEVEREEGMRKERMSSRSAQNRSLTLIAMFVACFLWTLLWVLHS